MDGTQFDNLIKRLGSTPLSRLRALRGLAVGVAALTGVSLLTDEAGAKNKNKNDKKIRICVCASSDAATCRGQKKERKKAKKTLRRNACAYKGRCQSGKSGCVAQAPAPGPECQNSSQCGAGLVCVNGRCQSPPPAPLAPLTVSAPFTIEASWTADSDHDTYLFVPNEAGNDDPNPYINYSCRADNSDCEEEYPFACVSGDALTAGEEVTTIFELLNGTYQYWIELDTEAPAGEVTVELRDTSGNVVMTWSSPANPDDHDQFGWLVFTVDGSTGIVTSVDQLFNEIPDDNTNVCPT